VASGLWFQFDRGDILPNFNLDPSTQQYFAALVTVCAERKLARPVERAGPSQSPIIPLYQEPLKYQGRRVTLTNRFYRFGSNLL
jgi:hypothetical protein